MNSIDNQYIYAAIYNPFLRKFRMLNRNSCYGCSELSFPYDRYTPYKPYCNVFDVWNEYKEVGFGYNVFPNEICLHLRKQNLMSKKIPDKVEWEE